jgi:hypothetical protein
MKKQLIHPAELGSLHDVLPKQRQWTDTVYTSLKEMLAGLLIFDSRGLSFDRKPEVCLVWLPTITV